MQEILESLKVSPPDISTDNIRESALKHYNLEGTICSLGGERDRNFLMETTKEKILFKVANVGEADEILDLQCAALQQIKQQDPSLPTPTLIPDQQGRMWASTGSKNQSFRLRAFSYLEGVPMGQSPEDSALTRNLGQTMARINLALRSLFHPAADHPIAWNIQSFDQISMHVSCIEDEREKGLVIRSLQRFNDNVKPKLPSLRHQIIHNDISFHNTVVKEHDPSTISGIYDFGDMVYAPMIQDLATTAAEIPAGCKDPLARSAEIIAGYDEVMELEECEIELLPNLMISRLAICLLIESWSSSANSWSDDRDHYDGWRIKCADYLENMLSQPRESLSNLFRSCCGRSLKNDTDVFSDLAQTNTNKTVLERTRLLGNASYTAYKEPLHLVKGSGVWLYDNSGNRYLDVYNNVPHAGHCHPRIVSAIAKQTATLNTNTRYVYDIITDYAQRLTQTLPEGLDVCYFVSSGSEANDLAWRLATNYTGNSGGLVIENAYHGVTEIGDALSPAERSNPTNPMIAVEQIQAPDEFRGEWKQADLERGPHYATYVDHAILELKSKGHRPAAFFMDMILSSSGVYNPAPGYLENVFDKVRAAGGLCVADEVQSGFGRTGHHMWGFQIGDVIPDIVTFGKPIAGGYPMGLVVTTRDIADKFEQSTEFFSTTGGNPVACAAANAMLDVIENEDLLNNAIGMGEEITKGIKQLAEKFPIIGDVRGSGLFIGVELVRNPNTLEPAPEEASKLLNILRDERVLIGKDGIHKNVLKIRPPMVFNSSHVKILLKKLEIALSRI